MCGLDACFAPRLKIPLQTLWVVEKDRDQTSALVSLSEFSPRKNEALERGYLMGRYGGVPFLSHTPRLTG
jgi:hypothetical protein